jgi:hypothetical protein
MYSKTGGLDFIVQLRALPDRLRPATTEDSECGRENQSCSLPCRARRMWQSCLA